MGNKLDWKVTLDFRSGCSLSIHWWGQSSPDNLVLVIPNGSCPPFVTAVYRLVSNVKHLSRYFQDMAVLDLRLVVGKQNTNEEEVGVTLGNFYLEIGQLSDDHPVEGLCSVYDKSGTYLVDVTLKLFLVYDVSFDHYPGVTPHGLDTGDGAEEVVLPGNFKTSTNISRNNEYGRSVAAQERDYFATSITMASSSPEQPNQLDFGVPSPDRGHNLPSSARLDRLSDRKPLLMDVEIPNKDRGHLLLPAGAQLEKKDSFSPWKQLIVDVEIPLGNRGHFESRENVDPFPKRKQVVMADDYCLSQRCSSSASSASDNEIPLMGQLPELSPNLRSLSSASSFRDAPLSRQKEIRTKSQTGSKKKTYQKVSSCANSLTSRLTALERVNTSVKIEGCASSSLARLHSPQRNKKAQNAGVGPKRPGRQSGAVKVGSNRGHLLTPRLDQTSGRKYLVAEVKVVPNRGDHSPSSAKIPKAHLQRTKRKQQNELTLQKSHQEDLAKENVVEARKLNGSHECNIHWRPVANEKHGSPSRSRGEDFQKQRCMDAATYSTMGGNLVILPGDEPGGQLGEQVGDFRYIKLDDSFYTESLRKLIDRLQAFRETLDKSSNTVNVYAAAKGFSPLSIGNELDSEKKSMVVAERFWNLDDSIGSVNRLLHSLISNAEDSEMPLYARVGQARCLEDDPKEVVETAIIEELFFPQKTNQEQRKKKNGCQIGDAGSEPLQQACHVHQDSPKPIPLVETQVEDLLTLRSSKNCTMDLKNTSHSPHLDVPYGSHGACSQQNENHPTLNLTLILTVGKLTLIGLRFEDPETFAPFSTTYPAARSSNKELESSSCLVTFSFPSLIHSASSRKSDLRQSFSISPIKLELNDAHFGLQSELHWKGLGMQSLEWWKSERIDVSALISFGTGEIGESLICHGSVLLEEVINSMPKGFQTKMNLFRSSEHHTGNRLVDEVNTKGQSASLEVDTKEKLGAKIEVGIFLLLEDLVCKPLMQLTHPGLLTRATWLYVTVSRITGCNLQPEKENPTGHLLLVVKSDIQHVCEIPFPVNWCEINGQGIQTWTLPKRRHSDAVLCGPKKLDNPILFIEIWRDWRVRELRRGSSLETLIGLVKVPLKVTSSFAIVKENCQLVANGEYSIWNPFRDVICGNLSVKIELGSEAQMLKSQIKNRAARVIQSYADCFKKRIKARKQECLGLPARNNPFVDHDFQDEYAVEMTRHVIEVSVQHAKDLPLSNSFKTMNCGRCDGAFIKYIFPCDQEPFYTQEMEWGRTMFFDASVHHGIILPANQHLENHLNKLTLFSENTGDLIFELWGCFTHASDEEKNLSNTLNLSYGGELSNWAMRRERYSKERQVESHREPNERLLGTAKLHQKSLLNLVSQKRGVFYSSPEVRKRFYIPLHLDLSQLDSYKRAPSLVVQVAYFILDIEDRRDHVMGTIFSGLDLHEDSFLEATLEFKIICATGLQTAVDAVFSRRDSTQSLENGVNSYVRYSLFPYSRQLELNYPPHSTPIKANDFSPQYDWTRDLKVLVNVQVLKELRTGHISFEVWHRPFAQASTKFRPLVTSDESRGTDLWLGTALVPCLPLLQNREGITGWHDLLSRKEKVVGALQVAVRFKSWRSHPL